MSSSSGTRAWKRLDRRGQQLGGGRPGGAGDRDRQPRGLRQPQREEPGAALVDVRVAAQAPLARERQHQRRAARPWRGAGRAHPAARQLVDERAQQQIGVGGGGHRMAVCRRASSCCTGSAAPTAPGMAWRHGSHPERYLPRALDLPGHGDGRRRAGEAADHVRRLCLPTCLPQPRALRAVRLLAGGARRSARRAGRARAREHGSCSSPPRAGIEDASERAERSASDHRLADELERGGCAFDYFIERWRTQPLFAGDPPEVGRLAREDQRRNRPEALAAVLGASAAGRWNRCGTGSRS